MKTTYATDGGDLVIEFDYDPAERATDVSPGCSESADVLSVMAGQIDILEFCDEASIAFFEEKCIEEMAWNRKQAEYDRAERECEEREAA